MKKLNILAISSVAIAGFAVMPQAQAWDWSTSGHYHAYYIDHDSLSPEQALALHRYLNYEQREPCQHYRVPPPGFVERGCDLVWPRVETVVQVEKQVQEQTQTQDAPTVLQSYKIYFAFDKSIIEPAAEKILDQVAREISTYNPSEVVVAGHADKAGPDDYNVRLSQRRADAVSRELTERGVANRIIEQAYGESRPAVDTADGMPLRENRRVAIEFLQR